MSKILANMTQVSDVAPGPLVTTGAMGKIFSRNHSAKKVKIYLNGDLMQN
jgi:hypothetical protein